MVLAGLAVLAGIVYGLLAKELAGAVMLGVFAVALLYIATVLEHAGPYDFAEIDQEAEPELGPEHTVPPSWWPVVMALGAGIAVIGLKFIIVIMGVGVAIFLAAVVGWFVQAGHQAADRAHHGEGH